MNSLTRIISYDKKKTSKENCDCVECTNDKIENQSLEYSLLSDEEIEQIIKEQYGYKDDKTKTFIRKALRKHGNEYDYSSVVYIKSDVKVEITCRVKGHESFLQTPDNHLKGQGCKICGFERRINKRRKVKEEFIRESKEIHGDKYDYSKVEYKNATTKVIIICPIHGDFLQTPDKHLRGQGCKICGGNKQLTKEEFIEKARKIHGDKYDYSNVNYINMKTKVIITCPKHGDFPQTPNKHLSGRGCRECQYEKVSELHKLDTKEFIKRAREIHGDKYDYSKVKYVGYDNEVIIICPKHCGFKQTPHVHFLGSGCPKCNSSKGEIAVRNYLITNKIEFEEQKKFNDCKDMYLLPFDFYIPQYNLCIEYDGLQHFKKVKWSNSMTEETSEMNFKYIQSHDQIKNNYCKSHNINLLRIKYDENTEEKLTKWFQNHKLYEN